MTAPRLAARRPAFGAPAAPEKKKRKRYPPKPRAAPLSIDDIDDLPAGPRVVLYWPPVELSPNWRGDRWAQIRKRKKYRADCAMIALEAGFHRLMHRAREVAAGGEFTVQVDFFPPPNVNTYDHDNVEAAFKAGRDGLSQSLGLDDAHFRTKYRHHPEQRSCLVVTLTCLAEEE